MIYKQSFFFVGYKLSMHWLMLAFVAVLFYVLTPGVFVRLPPGGSKMVVNATHAVVFALVYHFTHHLAWAYLGREGVDSTLEKKKEEPKHKKH